MNITETLEYIHKNCWKGSRPGLERTTQLLELMGNPHKNLKFIHIVGTNGKGSTAAMLDSVGYTRRSLRLCLRDRFLMTSEEQGRGINCFLDYSNCVI